jgi:hypothetical protein
VPEFDIREGGFREELHQFSTRALSREALVLLDRDDHGALLAVDCDVLRSLFYGPTHHLAEARLGVLKLPAARISAVGDLVYAHAVHGCAHHLVRLTRRLPRARRWSTAQVAPITSAATNRSGNLAQSLSAINTR